MSKPTLKVQLEKLTKELHDLKNLSKHIPLVYDSEKVINKDSSRLFRVESDLKLWRNAIANVEQVTNPVYAELIRIQNEVALDSIIVNACEIRKNYVMSRNWHFKNKQGVEDEKASEFFSDFWFNEFINYVIDSIFNGYELIKIGDIEDDKLTCVDIIQKQNVNPKLKRVLQTPMDLKSGFDFTNENVKDWYILVSDSSHNHYEGLLTKAAPYQIIHKAALLAQIDYVNRFGSPNLIIRSDMNAEKQLRQLEAYASNFNNTSYLIANLTDDIQLLESSGKGGEIYNTIQERVEGLIYKLILGSELGAEKSFVGSAAVREGITNLFSYSDMKYVTHYVNNELIPRLVNLGLTFLTDITFSFDTTDKTDPSTQFNQLIQLLGTGQFTADAKYIEETFGIKVSSLTNVSPVFGEDEKSNTEDVPTT